MLSFEVIVLSCLSAACLFSSGIDARYVKRSAESNEICLRSAPCGWELYSPNDKTVIDFVESPCKCEEGRRCMKTSDDIAISAIVFKCLPLSEDSDYIWSTD